MQKAPLHRALFCLNNALHICELSDSKFIEAIQVSLAYVYLELGDASSALHVCMESLTAQQNFKNSSCISLKRRERLKVYGCEASCLLGNPVEALHLLGLDKETVDGDEKFLQKDFSILKKSDNIGDPSQLFALIAKCAARATNNNFDFAKVEAGKAFACNNNSVRSKNALLYCLLQNGDTEAALQLLRS